MKESVNTLRDQLASLVEALGYEFVGCELQRQGRDSVLRIFIDSVSGVNLDDCTKVSRQVSAMLDVEDPIPGRYTLEISSPGLDRPLFEIQHYKKQIGQRVKLRLKEPVENRRNIVGILLRVEEMNIHLKVDEEEIVVPFSKIEKGKVIIEQPFSLKDKT